MIDALHTLWDSPVASYWLVVAWIISAAGWGFLGLLWAVQARWAHSHGDLGLLVVHSLKVFAAVVAFLFFLLSLMWRNPDGVISFGAWSRNLAGWIVVLVLVIEAVYRLREKVKREALEVAARMGQA